MKGRILLCKPRMSGREIDFIKPAIHLAPILCGVKPGDEVIVLNSEAVESPGPRNVAHFNAAWWSPAGVGDWKSPLHIA